MAARRSPTSRWLGSYGELNDARDNVILITHFFSGTSHAAGRYEVDGQPTGYWDAIIGPGKPLDTDEYYIISSDTLVNLNANDPNVTTTGPASINPDTGEPGAWTSRSSPSATLSRYSASYSKAKALNHCMR